jgi:NAD(P)-dependent dehydrogenase (short-subunit alcohol dehydrogenase family)
MSEDRKLTGKVAIVFGGSRGIGAAAARRLARDGANVGFRVGRPGGTERKTLATAAITFGAPFVPNHSARLQGLIGPGGGAGGRGGRGGGGLGLGGLVG